jgi:hypothetical protein
VAGLLGGSEREMEGGREERKEERKEERERCNVVKGR